MSRCYLEFWYGLAIVPRRSSTSIFSRVLFLSIIDSKTSYFRILRGRQVSLLCDTRGTGSMNDRWRTESRKENGYERDRNRYIPTIISLSVSWSRLSHTCTSEAKAINHGWNGREGRGLAIGNSRFTFSLTWRVLSICFERKRERLLTHSQAKRNNFNDT